MSRLDGGRRIAVWTGRSPRFRGARACCVCVPFVIAIAIGVAFSIEGTLGTWYSEQSELAQAATSPNARYIAFYIEVKKKETHFSKESRSPTSLMSLPKQSDRSKAGRTSATCFRL
jgi:hypothetical protein